MNTIYNSIIEFGHYTRRNGYKPALFKNDKCKTYFVDKRIQEDKAILKIIDSCIKEMKAAEWKEEIFVNEWRLAESYEVTEWYRLDIRIVFD